MLISWNWLNRHVDLSGLDAREVGEQFTLKVAELDGVHEIGGGLDKMRCVRVESVAPVEGADKLTQVTVQDGETVITVVCGAPNARDSVGKIAVLCPSGSVMPDGKEIGTAVIRGVESSGMLASEAELGLSEDHDGIVLYDPLAVAPGQSFPHAVPVHDWVWEVDNKAITHRPDLWGHHGIAREVSVLVDRPFKDLDPRPAFGTEQRVTVSVQDAALCPRYMATVFEGVTVGPSPHWLQCLLRATGVRPISNVVDLTNFVMMDAGNPIHAFDARFVSGNAIDVRRATEGEIIKTLDGQDRVCTAETLLICDADKPVAVAGVMGGENSEIRDDTTDVILEAANFDPGSVRKTSVRLGLRTDASARFEKALDPASADTAARHFTQLMLDIIPGCRVVSPLVDIAAPTGRKLVVPLNPAAVSQRLGIDVPIGRIRRVLSGLGFEVQDRSSGLLHVGVPSWRATRDVAIPEDLIEEIGRAHGYLNIPQQPPRVEVQKPLRSPAKAQEKAAKRYLSAACGMNEVLSYAFTWTPMLERLGAPIGDRLELANKISADMGYMRQSMIPNLLKFVEENSRYFSEFGLYEIGRVFEPIPDELPHQPRRLAMVRLHGDVDAETQWRQARGAVEGVLQSMGANGVSLKRMTEAQIGGFAAWIHPTRSAGLFLDDQIVGYVSLLHPRARQVLEPASPCSLAEIDLDRVLAGGKQDDGYQPLPKYPGVGFDLSFEVDEAVPSAAVGAVIEAARADNPL
ncbi:MAG: phenylalanyl-tRNA synthetase beta chain, partial [Myxococcota bacterium]